MAGSLDTGQLLLTYLFFLPSLFSWLISELHLAIGMLCSLHRLWHSVRFHAYHRPIKHCKKKSFVRPPPKLIKPQEMARTYFIMAFAVSLFKVGCRVESLLSHKFRFRVPFCNPARGPLYNALPIRHIPLHPHHPLRKFVSTRTHSRSASTTIAQSRWSNPRTTSKTLFSTSRVNG